MYCATEREREVDNVGVCGIHFGMFPPTRTVLNRDYNRGYHNPYYKLLV